MSDEGYYARCVRTDGSEQWYRVADELVLAKVTGAREAREARVLPMRRRRAGSRTAGLMLTHDAPLAPLAPLVVKRPARMILFGRGRSFVLVGTSRRSRPGAGVSR